MKQIITIIAAVFISSLASAQITLSEPQERSNMPSERVHIVVSRDNNQQGQSRYEQIQSAKIAFFTTELELTPKEAEDFWPVYNKYWKERETAYRKIQSNLKMITKAVTGETKVTDSELKVLTENYVEGFAAEGEIQKEYFAEFSKILPLRKVAKLYRAEEMFRVKMIHQLRKSGGQGPGPGSR